MSQVREVFHRYPDKTTFLSTTDLIYKCAHLSTTELPTNIAERLTPPITPNTRIMVVLLYILDTHDIITAAFQSS